MEDISSAWDSARPQSLVFSLRFLKHPSSKNHSVSPVWGRASQGKGSGWLDMKASPSRISFLGGLLLLLGGRVCAGACSCLVKTPSSEALIPPKGPLVPRGRCAQHRPAMSLSRQADKLGSVWVSPGSQQLRGLCRASCLRRGARGQLRACVLFGPGVWLLQRTPPRVRMEPYDRDFPVKVK